MKPISYLANPKFVSELHPNFAPLSLAIREFNKKVNACENAQDLFIAIERSGGQMGVLKLKCFPEDNPLSEFNFQYAERNVKFLLWQKGGFKVYIHGSKSVYEYVKECYSPTGSRAFDNDFMSTVYGEDFQVVYVEDKATFPEEKANTVSLGGNLKGCRIGFDLGASDRKVSAVIDGEAVYTEEVVWNPRDAKDPQYHFDEINAALKSAASHMPRVDAIGGSSAGVIIDNRPRIGSLFRGVSKDDFKNYINPLFLNLQKEWGVPFEVVNDGEVTALAGAMGIEDTGVLGCAMGSSEAGGYVNLDGQITTWLNELAFCPVDASLDAPMDEWSGDIGVGAMYFSQQAVFHLAKLAGFKLDETLSLAAKLKSVQKYLEADDERAIKIWETIGIYLGYGVANYANYYDLKHVLILGRVTSGKGGDIVLNKAKEVLSSEFPELANINIMLPDEKARRVGQAVAAASLAETE